MTIEIEWYGFAAIMILFVAAICGFCTWILNKAFSPEFLASRREENIAKLKQEIKDSRTEQNEGDG